MTQNDEYTDRRTMTDRRITALSLINERVSSCPPMFSRDDPRLPVHPAHCVFRGNSGTAARLAVGTL